LQPLDNGGRRSLTGRMGQNQRIVGELRRMERIRPELAGGMPEERASLCGWRTTMHGHPPS
jgi:hypothetical protein